jgi:hypothetical protein
LVDVIKQLQGTVIDIELGVIECGHVACASVVTHAR